MDEAEFERYLEIGRKNKEVIDLLRNWCRHARVEQLHGGGILEAHSGLPISHRQISCQHRRASGIASMDMEANALDYYDRNCFDCEHRDPVGFPNISLLLGERDRDRREEAERKHRQERENERRLASRRQCIDCLKDGESELTTELLDAIIGFDSEPSTTEAELLAETFRAAPKDALTPSLVSGLECLADESGNERTAGTLAALEAVNYPLGSLVDLALAALARGDDPDICFDLIARGLDERHLPALKEAVPALVMRCHPNTLASRFHDAPSPKPEALLAAFRVAQTITANSLREALQRDSKYVRCAAASAILYLLQHSEASAASIFQRDLIASFMRPDDSYDDGPAAAYSSRALAECLKVETEAADRVLSDALAHPDERVCAGALSAYQAIFWRPWEERSRSGRNSELKNPPAPWEAHAFRRILSFFSSLPDSSSLGEVFEFFRRDFGQAPFELQLQAVEPLLGVAALASEQLEDLLSGRDQLTLEDPRPPEIIGWDRIGREGRLSHALTVALEAVEEVVRKHPSRQERNRVIEMTRAMLHGAPTSAEILRARLLGLLTRTARFIADPSTLLRDIYCAMTSPSVRVRSEAARSYQEVCSRFGADSLPPLLHETFLLLLQDPYVAVHRSALNAAGHIPSHFRRRVLHTLDHILAVYSDSTNTYSQGEILLSALRGFYFHLGSDATRPPYSEQLLMIARRLPERQLYEFVTQTPKGLKGVPGFGDVLLLHPLSSNPLDHQTQRLLEVLRGLPIAELERCADRILELALTSHRPTGFLPAVLLQVLIGADLLDQGRRLASYIANACGDGEEHKRLRLEMRIDEAAIALEQACERRDSEGIAAQAARMRELEQLLAEDDEQHRERRGVFPVRAETESS